MIGMRTAVRGGRRAEDAISAFFVDDEKIARGAELIFAYLRDDTKKNFESQSSGMGDTWPEYTGSEFIYGIIKRKMLGDAQGRRKLRWSPGRERLFPSVTEDNHPEQIAEIDGRMIRFGTRVPYAANHQFGFGQGPAWAGFPRIKQRQFLNLGPRQIANIRRIMAGVTGI